ncbi:uncharacterized protein [Gossypium hirsutum]|uniref:Uncharacterized protein isoform X2 n=1 Tax=Gossypium hirsutum TaxID=3635 RepID=A0ABM3AU26_GOSHI|nr:uncharacterized protein LOC107913640 isoform X2 [Gossypium hirsutum]
MKRGLRRKRVLRSCNSKSVRRSSSLTPILQMQRNTGADEIEKFIKFQDEEMQAFVAERDKLIKAHEKKMVGMRERHWQEEVELEKEFDAELSHLMEKYTLDGSKSMPAILDCGIVGECDGFLKSCSTVTFQKILNLKKFDLWETMLCQLGGQMDLAKSLPMISSR